MCDFVFTDNHYLINRCDGLIIDGNPSGVSQQIYSMNREKENAKIRILKKTDEFKELEPFKENPYAIAHYVNHSPTRANVFCCDYNFPLSTPQPLQCYIPNVDFSHTEKESCIVPSLVFLAARDLEDEEVFLNYNFNTSDPSKLPGWYCS
eukprot:TRINITY_DN1419_c0_g1_i3.p1 TRINITY_DN1419_c0_g1~~TRINITY_DN1419_c0_g1_i3.p1  ORF type:complete len:150 (+),score=15.32 TRINITY_DN1419_c0_g1_i3:329-778(+)